MSAEPSVAILELEVPVPLAECLADRGWIKPRLEISTVGLCLSICAEPKRFKHLEGAGAADAEDAFHGIALAARSIRQSLLQEGLVLPVVVVVEAAWQAGEGGDSSFRSIFDRWAGDQDWHRGEFALYLSPPLSSRARLEEMAWMGPKTREEMVRHLLGPGPQDWRLDPPDRHSVAKVARQLEAWAEDHGLSRSELHGDLLFALADALDRFAREGAGARTAAGRQLDDAIDAWASRNLAVAPRTEAGG